MSNWKKIDSDAAKELESVSGAVTQFMRRNVHGLVESRHIGSGMGYNVNHAPLVSSGTTFPIEVPFLIPATRWADEVACLVHAEATVGDVVVSLVIDGVEGTPVTFLVATGAPEVREVTATLPATEGREFVRATLRIQSEAISDGSSGKATLASPTKIRFDHTGGSAWAHAPDGKTHGELVLTNLSADSPEATTYYFGASAEVGISGSNVYEVAIWPPIEDDTGWVYATGGAVKSILADVYTMSQLEVLSVGWEVRGNRYAATDVRMEPGGVVRANRLAGLATDLQRLRAERAHWFCCGFKNQALPSGTNMGYVGLERFGGNMIPLLANNIPSVVASFPAEVRSGTIGLKVSILYAQIGRTPESRAISLGASISGSPVLTRSEFAGDVYRQSSGPLFAAHSASAPLTWGTEDAIGVGEVQQLSELSVVVPWPGGMSPGTLAGVDLSLADNSQTNTNVTVHLFALSAIEFYGDS